jgi:hypothetical protein
VRVRRVRRVRRTRTTVRQAGNYLITNAGVEHGDSHALLKALSGEAGSNPDKYLKRLKDRCEDEWLESQHQWPTYWASLQLTWGEMAKVKNLKTARQYTPHEKYELMAKHVRVVFPRINDAILNKGCDFTLIELIEQVENQRLEVGLSETISNPQQVAMRVNAAGCSGEEYGDTSVNDGQSGGEGAYDHTQDRAPKRHCGVCCDANADISLIKTHDDQFCTRKGGGMNGSTVREAQQAQKLFDEKNDVKVNKTAFEEDSEDQFNEWLTQGGDESQQWEDGDDGADAEGDTSITASVHSVIANYRANIDERLQGAAKHFY